MVRKYSGLLKNSSYLHKMSVFVVWWLHDIWSYAISTYSISMAAFLTALNFNLLHFQISAVSTYPNFGYLVLIRLSYEFQYNS